MSRRRRSRHTPAANGSKWIHPSTRWAIYYRDDFQCLYCESVGPVLTLDHMKSCEEGGTHEASNLVTCCLSCNSAKKSLSSRSWYRQLRKRGLDTGPIRDRIYRAVRRALDRERGRLLARVAEHEPTEADFPTSLFGDLPAIDTAFFPKWGVLEKGAADRGEDADEALGPDADEPPLERS